MTIAFGVERLADVWDEFEFLAMCHWAETDMARNGEVLNLDRNRYLRYGDTYLLFTVRDEGKLVGQCGIYVTPSMHTQEMIATEDALYFLPEARRGRRMLDFHKFFLEEMRKRGVSKVFMTAAPYNGACRLLEYIGYRLSCYKYELDLTMRASTGADSAVTDPTVTETDHVLA